MKWGEREIRGRGEVNGTKKETSLYYVHIPNPQNDCKMHILQMY